MSIVSWFKDANMAVVTSYKNQGLGVLLLLKIPVRACKYTASSFFFFLFFLCQIRVVGCFYQSLQFQEFSFAYIVPIFLDLMTFVCHS